MPNIDNQKKTENILRLFEEINTEIKIMLEKKSTNSSLLVSIKKQVFELLSFFISFDDDLDSQHKSKVYTYIAKFIQDKIDKKNNSFNTCLSAVYSICGETDSELITEIEPSIKTQELISLIKEQLIAVKVHYYRDIQTNSCSQKTEIFALLAGASKPILKKIEESGIDLDDLPKEIRDIFIEEKKESISFQIYQS
ncbi:hypothetical protein CAL7716_013550 [Calothrix sp. PCC 7716]|nr:hypothetical protein CAL7716_013550 [Calothrix sp. PCC 7716]